MKEAETATSRKRRRISSKEMFRTIAFEYKQD
jgi:hypothetical protein